MKILVVKNQDYIIISRDCKKLIVRKGESLFDKLSPLSEGEIVELLRREVKS